MAVPGLSSSSGSEGLGCNGGHGNNMRDLDMNQPASGGEEEEFPMGSVEEDEEERGAVASGPHRPKKLRLSKEQSRLMEESFRLHHTLTPALAVKLNLRPRQVEVWFQNRRARTKLKQTELECEYLKRCFGSLTEENRRLQREVEELRAMRVAPPTVITPHTRQPLPASALTMCPRCERITAATGAPALRPAAAANPFHPRRPSAAF
nr:unnamed protein product [Digitaria exilis]